MNAMIEKKRKKDNDFRVFNDDWTTKYFFTSVNNVPTCIICKSTVAVCKKYNIERHHSTVHQNYMPYLNPEERIKHAEELKQQLMSKQRTDEEMTNLHIAATASSFFVAYNIARDGKPYSDGEFVKKCMVGVCDFLCPEETNKFESVSISRPTVTRRIEQIEVNISEQLAAKINSMSLFSVAMDESSDIVDTAQLLIFIRVINDDLEITEELLSMISLKGRTTGEIIFNEIETCFSNHNLEWQKLFNVATDGAPNFTGKNIGVVARMKRKVKEFDPSQEIVDIHCIIHQFSLCKDVLNMPHITTVVVKLVNWLRSHALRHRQFQALLEEVGTEHLDVLYHNSVRWLSLGKVFDRVFELKDEIVTFLTLKNNESFTELADPSWMLDFAFSKDLMHQINIWNKMLQGRNHYAHDMAKNVITFKTKIELFHKHLLVHKFQHFPALDTLAPVPKAKITKYTKILKDLLTEFDRRFACLHAIEGDLSVVRNPFLVDADSVPDDLQLEIIELQCDDGLHALFEKVKEENIEAFYQKLDITKFKNLRTLAKRMLVIFGSTYICEQTFSGMKHNKNKLRSRLTDAHLEASLKISTSHFEPDFEKLVGECKLLHLSH